MNLQEAKHRGLPGWNLRCNLCGEHPATWLPGERSGAGGRAGGGSLALCCKHKEELRVLREKISELKTINFEQLSESELR